MTTAMQGSVTVLFWSFVFLGLVSIEDVCVGRKWHPPCNCALPMRLLMVVQTLIAFTLNQALDSYFKDKTKPATSPHITRAPVFVYMYIGLRKL